MAKTMNMTFEIMAPIIINKDNFFNILFFLCPILEVKEPPRKAFKRTENHNIKVIYIEVGFPI
tara:strand:- start:9 stop:197 length:189 start_codon:yes stop_codon:yes gene_type:complete